MVIKIDIEIKIEEIWASNDEELEQKLNSLNATRIISVEHLFDSMYKVIYEL